MDPTLCLVGFSNSCIYEVLGDEFVNIIEVVRQS